MAGFMRSALFGMCLAISFVCAGGAVAQDNGFYKGKRLTVLINYAPGGATDVEGRFFVKYLTKHLLGNSGITVQNMDGGGGLVAVNYLGEVAPRDGSVVGYLSGAAWQNAASERPSRVPFNTYEFVASQPGIAIYFARRDIPPGIKEPIDFVRSKGVVAGGLAVDLAKDLTIRLTLDLLGVPFKYVTGYKGSQGARLALQQNEINMFSESLPSYKSIIETSMVSTGEVVPLYIDPDFNNPNAPVPKELRNSNIVSFLEYYRKAKGKEPEGDLWEAYRTVVELNTSMQRLIVLPPNSPAAATSALQSAIGRINADKEYEAEALKVFGAVPTMIADAGINARIRPTLQISAATKKWMANYVANPPR